MEFHDSKPGEGTPPLMPQMAEIQPTVGNKQAVEQMTRKVRLAQVIANGSVRQLVGR
jgi:hypothetical protein